jgi:hypothetical protein
MGESWVQGREVGDQISKAAQRPPTSGSTRPLVPKLNTKSVPDLRQSIFNDLPPKPAPMNVATNITVLTSPTLDADEQFMGLFSPSTSRPSISSANIAAFQSGTLVATGNGYESDKVIQDTTVGLDGKKASKLRKSSSGRPRSSSVTSSRSRSSSNNSSNNSSQNQRRPIPPISTDPKYITPEMRSTAVFPNTPPASVSPATKGFPKPPPRLPDASLTPPQARTAPTKNVIKALKDRNISEPTLLNMTATVPTVPIIRMGDDKLDKLRSDRRKTSRTKSSRKARRAMLDDDQEDDVQPTSPVFNRRKTSTPVEPLAPRRRETTAGSVIFDDLLRDGVPPKGERPPTSAQFRAGPEYSVGLPPPHQMGDTSYHPSQQKPRHRRKVSRQEADPQATLSSPAIMNQWDGFPERRMDGRRMDGDRRMEPERRMDAAAFHPKRRMDGAVDPAW